LEEKRNAATISRAICSSGKLAQHFVKKTLGIFNLREVMINTFLNLRYILTTEKTREELEFEF